MADGGDDGGDDGGNAQGWDGLVRRRALWLQSFWFVRGVMGTMALVALIPEVTELARIEALRALYALILGWNGVMSWLGRMIGEIPFIPAIPGAVVSTAVFFVSIPLPLIIGAAFETSRRSFLSIQLFLFNFVWIGWVTIIYYEVAFNDGHYFYQMSTADYVIFPVCVGAAIYFGFRGAFQHLPGFRAGLLFTAGVIATIVIGYNIGTTEFSDRVNAAVCAELDIAPADCAPTG